MDDITKVKTGDKLKAEMMSIDTIDRRLFLTMKNIGAERPAGQAQRKHEDRPAAAGTLGDLIKEKLGGKLDLK